MYYNIRLDKILPDGRVDMGESIEWDYPVLADALSMLCRKFAGEAASWYIESLPVPTSNLMSLEGILRNALESMHQCLVMTFREGVSASERYDRYAFFVIMRDELIRPPTSLLLEEAKTTATTTKGNKDEFLNLYDDPVPLNIIASDPPICICDSRYFYGLAVVLKNGTHLVVFGGEKQKQECIQELIQLGEQGIDKEMINSHFSRIGKEFGLQGYKTRLASGEILQLTIAKTFETRAFVKAMDAAECFSSGSIEDKEEVPVDAPLDSLGQSIKDILQSFETDMTMYAGDYINSADSCRYEDEQLAAKLYANGYRAEGRTQQKGQALIQLARLYMDSDWPKFPSREWDVMKAVDLLTGALALGCVQEAREALDAMRKQIFEEYENEPDVDYFIGHYQADALCLAAFCLGVGVGWKTDVVASEKLFSSALAQGYSRASRYLREIQRGRIGIIPD